MTILTREEVERMFEENEPLVYLVYNRRIDHSPITKELEEELLQEGRIGLYRGCKKYDPNSGFTKSTYLSKCIQNQMIKFLEHEYRTRGLPTCSFDEVISTDYSSDGSPPITLGETIAAPEDYQGPCGDEIIEEMMKIYRKHVMSKRNKNMQKNIHKNVEDITKILHSLYAGKTFRQIAADMNVSATTVTDKVRSLKHILLMENYVM